MTYTTNLDLDIDGRPEEVDFAFWYQRDGLSRRKEEPAFVAGEAKSFALEAIRKKDVDRLRRLAIKLPGTFLVFTVLKDQLSKQEKDRIANLALWGRTALGDGRPRAPVIVFTGTELFAEHSLRETWKELGGKHAQLVKPASVRLDNLWTLADFTQQLYLDLPS